MNTSVFDSLSIVCPACQAVNTITASEVSGDSRVNCSKCRCALGTWRDVKNKAENHDAAFNLI